MHLNVVLRLPGCNVGRFALFNQSVTNGRSNPYHLDESTFIVSDFHF